ncbi:DUF1592 domain-containing protein [Schlesneria paludicola]|uniref:DUF1592 domain-containing protein n=1 Tax=Schlesneria paludicola TaxID=360056 RepID=UPI00029A3220|nr:DUF1592 domain-containing protein [Schlesneria paludicola]
MNNASRTSANLFAPSSMRFLFFATLLMFGVSDLRSWGDDPTARTLDIEFQQTVRPFLKSYCLDCHGAEKQEAKLDLSREQALTSVTQNLPIWETVAERLLAGDMPPESSDHQPTAEARRAVVTWCNAVGEYEAARNAGDPGVVLAHRLSNAEYDNSIRDLTGFDLRPTREFPVDPANEAGFDNTGESLSVSPALIKKYLDAARFVANHAVLTPRGIVFAPYPVVTETDLDQFCVHQILEFYQQHEIDYADYFAAAWRFHHRSQLGRSDATLKELARETKATHSKSNPQTHENQAIPARGARRATPQASNLSERYLETIWSALTHEESVGPLAELQTKWHQLISNEDLIKNAPRSDDPSPTSTSTQTAAWNRALRQECETLRDFVVAKRTSFEPPVPKLHLKGMSDGSQPLVIWWNRKQAATRMSFLRQSDDKELDAAIDRFCRIFPSAFAISSRGHYADPKLGVGVRFLTAGFHLMQGYFRDDGPLYELVLSDIEQSELDSLWQTLNFVTQSPIRQYKDFLFFERAEPPGFAEGPDFDFARPENKDVTTEVSLNRVRDLYLAKARRLEASPAAIEAIESYFSGMSAEVRELDRTATLVESTHLEALKQLAARCFRRPLTHPDQQDLDEFYRALRENEGLSHDEAIRDVLTGILMSPHFCYRFSTAAVGTDRQPLDDYELASRLSDFLWASLPDAELLACAERGTLHDSKVLLSQAKRMLRDARVCGLASEFAANWLDIRRFEEHNSVDRERFPSFTNELRSAMYEEPLRLFIDVIRENRPVTELITADYTFVNPVLANHYGLNLETSPLQIAATGDLDPSSSNDWHRVDRLNRHGRGGLLTMSIFLTKNSPGLRTSPVKRGYWVVRRLLGERIPAPPPDVPELPKDEAGVGELSLPQLLARHRDHRTCASCHQRFDSIGLVFEAFGPIGEYRTRDLGGRPVVTTAVFPDGTQATGVENLKKYLSETRRDEFVTNFCRKLFSYAIGRSLLPSDRATIEEMRRKLRSHDDRTQTLVESILTSPQFLNKRGQN